MKRALVFIVLAVVLLAVYALAGHALPDIGDLKANLQPLTEWVTARPIGSALVFFVLYVVITALSVPLATVATLAAGALFGFWKGLALVSFASSLGATLAFLAARLLLRDAVQERFSNRLVAINEGFRKDGAFYLFTLRLLPIVPFFLVNLTMGLTPIKAKTFYWVSQVGMLAATAVFVNAGTQIAKIDSLKGILSPALIGSFVLIGLFPWFAKIFVDWQRRKNVYARWSRPKRFDRNLIVIGAGSAGLVSAYIAAAVKAKVTLVEANKMGGDCLNYGCVPSKALIRSAKLAAQIRKADRFGLSGSEPHFSFPSVMQRIRDVIAQIAPHDSVERYEGLGVEVLSGYARIKDPWTVSVRLADGTDRHLTTRSIIIATGARPFVPPLPGIEDSGYVTSDTLWDRFANLSEPPRRLVVLGGGPIGCELAQSFARLGSEVTQIEMADRLLVREDSDVSDYVRNALEADGVRVLTSHKALACGRDGDQKHILVSDGKREMHIPFDELVCAVGRSARLTGFGLEELAIPTERTVTTNAYLETILPNILAAGDVAGPYQFTHTAAHQAWFATVNALFGTFKRFKADYRVIPWATFTDPEVARVGINEQEARQQGIAYEVTRYAIDDLDRAIAESAGHGFIKVLTAPGHDRILGVTIVGEHAGDIIAEFVLAMKHGLGLNKILGTIHAYPTFAEANKMVAGEWRRAHVSRRLLAILDIYHRFMRGASS